MHTKSNFSFRAPRLLATLRVDPSRGAVAVDAVVAAVGDVVDAPEHQHPRVRCAAVALGFGFKWWRSGKKIASMKKKIFFWAGTVELCYIYQ